MYIHSDFSLQKESEDFKFSFTGTIFSPAEMDLNTTWSPGVLFYESSFLTVWFLNYEPRTFTEVKESEVSITWSNCCNTNC